MKAYVIKNKEGKYYRGYDCLLNKEIFVENILDATIEDGESGVDAEFATTYDIVPITIYEGDPLELACEELKARDENKTHAKLVIQQIKNKWLGENVDYKDWFIQQAKEIEDE